MTIISVQYNKEYKKYWDDFIDNSKNGTFLLKRDYMEYHSDRFNDYSIMFFENGKLTALLPASIKDGEVCSHGGLTYGGIISDSKMTADKMLEIFESMLMF